MSHVAAEKAAEMLLQTQPGQAAVTASAGLLLVAAPVLAPVVAVGAATLALTAGVAWGIGKLVEALTD